MSPNDAISVLNYFRQLAQRRDQPLDSVLKGLVPLFQADGIGLCDIESGSADLVFPAEFPRDYPWQTDDDLLNRLRASLAAEVHQDDTGNWLISPAGESQLFWAFRAAKRGWTEMDQLAWTLAGQMLARWQAQADPSADPLRRRLEHSAIIPGRLGSADEELRGTCNCRRNSARR